MVVTITQKYCTQILGLQFTETIWIRIITVIQFFNIYYYIYSLSTEIYSSVYLSIKTTVSKSKEERGKYGHIFTVRNHSKNYANT